MLDDAHFNIPPTALYSDIIKEVFFDASVWMPINIKELSIDKFGRFAVFFKKIM